MLSEPRRVKPGLFITATDTGVGKTVTSCAIAASLRRSGLRVGVCKPIATGCRRDREGLVSDDAEAIAHYSDCRLPLNVINPVRYLEPLAPSTAAERTGNPVDWGAIGESMRRLDEASDVLIVEGIGGVMTPIDERRSVLDLAVFMGYPVVVVTRPGLGTLNHAALTCRAVRSAGLRLAGIVINGYHADTADTAELTNPEQLVRQNQTPILATLPECAAVAPHELKLPEDIVAAAEVVDWVSLCRAPAGYTPPTAAR